MDPADAEADAGRPEPVGERQQRDVASARDRDAVHLRALDEALEDRLAGRGLGERRVEVRLQVARVVDPEDPTLSARVDRLEHGGEPDRVDRGSSLGEAPDRRERRLRDPLLGERPPHRDLVRHAVRDVGADRREAEALGDRRDDRDGAVRRDRQRAVDGVPSRDLLDRVDVGEVDDLRDVRRLEPRRVGVAVDRDDADPALARLGDRAALVAARADEEDARHGAMLVEATVGNDRHEVGSSRDPPVVLSR